MRRGEKRPRRHLSPDAPWYYSEEENKIIRDNMRDVNSKVHREVLKRAQFIHENFLPKRTPETIRDRWYVMIGRRGLRNWQNKDIKDIGDLLSPSQKRRIRLRIRIPKSTMPEE